jgi:aspartokinase-like uncharacterized kinase
MTDGGKGGLVLVKLGGSLCGTPALRPCLARIVEAGPGARLIVPGGGPFADAVRVAETKLGLDAVAAHRMAILAMQQFGLFLQSLEPRLALVETAAEIEALAGAGVWLPWAMVGRDTAIPASWDVTSDSLALILATRLAAARLVLVKAAALPADTDLAALATAGLVDPAFPELAAGYTGEIVVTTAETAMSGTLPRDVSLSATAPGPI